MNAFQKKREMLQNKNMKKYILRREMLLINGKKNMDNMMKKEQKKD